MSAVLYFILILVVVVVVLRLSSSRPFPLSGQLFGLLYAFAIFFTISNKALRIRCNHSWALPLFVVLRFHLLTPGALISSGVTVLDRQVRVAFFDNSEVCLPFRLSFNLFVSLSLSVCLPPSLHLFFFFGCALFVAFSVVSGWLELSFSTLLLQVLSNICSVRAVWSEKEPRVWKFPGMVSQGFP